MNEDPRIQVAIDRDVAKFVAVVLGLGGILVGVMAVVAEGGLADNLVGQIALVVGVIGWLAYVMLDPTGVRTMLTGRQARYASNSLLMSVAFTAVLVIIFVLLFNLQGDVEFLSLDWTEGGQFPLSDQTTDLLGNLEEPVHVIGFYSAQSPRREDAKTWLQRYEQRSNGQFTYEFIDPVRRPGEVRQLDVEIPPGGAIVFTQAGRTAQATLADERNLTGALIRVQATEAKTVYALTGHGERPFDQIGEASLQRAGSVLERENFEIETLNLFESLAIPADADVLVIAGPSAQYRAEEIEVIKEYLDNGGALMVMVEPNIATGLRTSGVQGVTFSPDGALLATAGADDTAIIWDVRLNAPAATLSGHRDDVQSVAFSPDSKTVATGSSDATIGLWDTDGELLNTLQGHQGPVWQVAFSPDGRTLASAGLDQAVIIWDLASGEPTWILAGQAQMLDVAFSPDGELVAAASADGAVRLWDVSSGEEVTTQRPHTGAALSVAFSPDGSTVLSGALDGTVGVLDVASGNASTEALYPNIQIFDIIYANDEQVLVVLADLTVRVWDANLDDEQFQIETEHTDNIWQVAAAPNGNTFATASSDGSVQLWSLSSQERIVTLSGHTGSDLLLAYLAEAWGITANDDLVIEPDSEIDEFTLVSFDYGRTSPITEPLWEARLPTFFIFARSISLAPEPSPELTLTALVMGRETG